MNEKKCLGNEVSVTEESKHLHKLSLKCFCEDLRINNASTFMPPYVEFFIDQDTEYTKLAYIIQAIKLMKNFKVVAIPDGGFIYKNFEWYTPLLSFHLTTPNDKDIIPFFDAMFDSLCSSSTKKLDDVATTFLKICDAFKEKETGIIFRMQRNNEKFTFYAEIEKNEPNYEHLVSVLKAGSLSLNEKISTDFTDVYYMSSSTFSIFSFRLKELLESLESNLNIILSNSEYENMNFYHLVRMKRREFGESPDGTKKIQEFIEENTKKEYDDWLVFQDRVKKIEMNFQENV